jgi:outer membrane protein assembly factor BamB
MFLLVCAGTTAIPPLCRIGQHKVVPGGDIGGIIATAAVDKRAGRIYFSTAPGFDPFNPQRPTVHALERDTGTVLWQNTLEENADASFAPTSAIPGVVFIGSLLDGLLRAYDAATGEKLASIRIGFSLASAPAVVDGIVLIGAGIGERTGDPADPGEITSRIPQNVTALCVPGTTHCQ